MECFSNQCIDEYDLESCIACKFTEIMLGNKEMVKINYSHLFLFWRDLGNLYKNNDI